MAILLQDMARVRLRQSVESVIMPRCGSYRVSHLLCLRSTERLILLVGILCLQGGCDSGAEESGGSLGGAEPTEVPPARQIATRVEVKAGGRYLAFATSAVSSEGRRPGAGRRQIVVVDLAGENPRITPVAESDFGITMAWRPQSTPPVLFVVAGFTPEPQELRSFEIGDSIQQNLAVRLPGEGVGHVLSCNASGRVLALVVLETGWERRLRIASEASQWIPMATEIRLAGNSMAWLGESTLYVEASKGSKEVLTELEVTASGPHIRRELAEFDDLDVCGTLGEEVVYRASETIYRGSNAIYKSPEHVVSAIARGSVIVLRMTRSICVLNEDGVVLIERSFEPGVFVAALSPEGSDLYLLTADATRIERMSTLTLRDGKVIYSVYQN